MRRRGRRTLDGRDAFLPDVEGFAHAGHPRAARVRGAAAAQPRRQGSQTRPEEALLMNGKTVIVTGANSGIGFETAAALAAMGGRVVMTALDPGKGGAGGAA